MKKLIKNLFVELIKKATPCNHEYELEEEFRYDGDFRSYTVRLFKCKKCLKVKKIKLRG